jgi:PKD repeat protein
MYYLDIGFDDNTDNVTTPKIRRIRYVVSNQPPVASSSADTTSGPPPLTVNFSSAGSNDPEGHQLSYSWAFGDGTTSTAANPSHIYTQAGRYTARLTVSDGTNSTIGAPLTITVGNPPTPTILSPQDGATFRGGDVIPYSGTATDPEDGTLPASAFTWEIDFLHEGHVHPGLPVSGSKSGTFTIPVTGHDFSGNTRFRFTLTVTDSDGLSTSTSVIIWPQKVNLTFNTVPTGLTLYLDGVAHTAPFVYDTLIGFNHTIEARNQAVGATNYTFGSWSDGGAQQHVIVVPSADATYTATYTGSSSGPATPSFVQVASSTPQTPQTTVSTSFGQPQTAGNLNVVVVGWDNATANIVSVTDTAGNTYQVAAPTKRSSGNSQAIYFAKNVAGGSNTVTVTMNGATPYVDVRIAEYSGLDQANPLDVTSSGSGSNNQPDSGAATTTTPAELLVGAGTTMGAFTGAGSGYTSRIITQPDQDILEDRVVTTAGSARATASATTSNWVMQLVTFRAAGQ